jgi:hypothetical protein
MRCALSETVIQWEDIQYRVAQNLQPRSGCVALDIPRHFTEIRMRGGQSRNRYAEW